MNKREFGAAGERWGAAQLAIAACAETSHATLMEEGAKVDIGLAFRHAFSGNKLIELKVQVKRGDSYKLKSDQNHIWLSIDQTTRDLMCFSGYPGVLLWVPAKFRPRTYWFAGDPRNAIKGPICMPSTNYVRPSIRFDLTRLFESSAFSHGVPRQTVRRMDEGQVLSRAKKAYSDLQFETVHHPLVGKIDVTRFAWRHVTRRSKSGKDRNAALRLTSYLKHFLGKKPDRFVCHRGTIKSMRRTTTENRFLVCWYKNALLIDGSLHSLVLRIREEITFPTDWQTRPVGEDEISQSAKLASWWAKKE